MNCALNNPSPTTTQYERKLATAHENINAVKSRMHRHGTQGMFYVRCKYGKFVACLEDGRPKTCALRSEDINTTLIYPVCIHDTVTSDQSCQDKGFN